MGHLVNGYYTVVIHPHPNPGKWGSRFHVCGRGAFSLPVDAARWAHGNGVTRYELQYTPALWITHPSERY